MIYDKKTQEYIEIIKDYNFLPLENIRKCNEKIWHVLNCGHLYLVSPWQMKQIVRLNKIYKCKECKKIKTNLDYREWIFNNRNDIIPVEFYINTETPIIHFFIKCKHYIKIKPAHVKNRVKCGKMFRTTLYSRRLCKRSYCYKKRCLSSRTIYKYKHSYKALFCKM